MCRSADMRSFDYVDRDKLKIRAFCVRLILAKPCTSRQRLLPDSLTLVYLPRINGSPLEVDGCKIRPDSPAFVTLHRVVSSSSGDAVAYVSKERVRASEGVRYELCLGDVKLLKGVFRRSEEEEDEWSMGCKCLLEEELVGVKVVESEVCVAAEGRVAMCERVEMVVRRRRTKVRGMEEIPEAIERDEEEECCCCCCGAEEEEEESDGDGELTTAEVEGVGWAVDVGLWVMCLGVGLLISKASSRRLRRRKLF
uniref:Uncharacterized protein n=1 Tax=Kalanchoe fedtschenkoi TaxID=63787 RepID=A0A7N0UL02_KALFE